jgi:hypothetical protein
MDYYIAEKNEPSPSMFICTITEKSKKKYTGLALTMATM